MGIEIPTIVLKVKKRKIHFMAKKRKKTTTKRKKHKKKHTINNKIKKRKIHFMEKKRKKTATKRKTAKKKSGAKRGLTSMTYSVSSELGAIVGNGRHTRPQIVKKLWVYIKAKRLQDA